MSSPGSGRYTVYVPPASPRNEKLAKLFNNRAGDKATIYGAAYQTDQAAAADAVVKTATAPVKDGVGGLFPSDGHQEGDKQMFPEGVAFGFGNAPNIPKDVEWKMAGDPANPYTPDLTSPGPGKTAGTDKDVNPEISIEDVKGATYVPGAPGTGTVSPSQTSSVFGMGPLDKNKPLVKGKSSV